MRDQYMRPSKRHKQRAKLAIYRKLMGRIPLQVETAF